MTLIPRMDRVSRLASMVLPRVFSVELWFRPGNIKEKEMKQIEGLIE